MQWCGWLMALRYKTQSRGFDSRWVNQVFHLHNPAGCTTALGSTRPLTDMSTSSIPCGVNGNLCVRLTTLQPSFTDPLEILEASTSYSLQGLSRPAEGLLYFYVYKLFAFVGLYLGEYTCF
jgi:hypothetical protein